MILRTLSLGLVLSPAFVCVFQAPAALRPQRGPQAPYLPMLLGSCLALRLLDIGSNDNKESLSDAVDRDPCFDSICDSDPRDGGEGGGS